MKKFLNTVIPTCTREEACIVGMGLVFMAYGYCTALVLTRQ